MTHKYLWLKWYLKLLCCWSIIRRQDRALAHSEYLWFIEMMGSGGRSSLLGSGADYSQVRELTCLHVIKWLSLILPSSHHLPSPREQGDVSTFLCALLVGLLQRERNVCFVAFCFLQVLFKYVSTRGFWLVHSAGICSKAIGNCNRNWPKWSWHWQWQCWCWCCWRWWW